MFFYVVAVIYKFIMFLYREALANSSFGYYPEMEFLDIILTKDLSLLLYVIHSPFYWRILKILKILTINPQNKKTRSLEDSS